MSRIDLSHISLNYNLDGHAVPVLHELDLSIESGEMVAILGPSGSGKSTLLYILGCLLKPSAGSYRLGGSEILGLSEIELAELRNRHFGFVFQQFHLLPRANLVQNLLLGTRYNRWDQRSKAEFTERALSLLKQVGMETHLRHRPHQLSGGQQQRVAIARALINDPALILADEPTGNLDSKSAKQVLDLLRSINENNGKTVIIITHDQEVARRCDRVISVLDGKIVGGKTMVGAPLAKAPRLEPPRSVFRPRLEEDCKTAWQNILRNKSRSFLTMLGVIIGVAAVLSTITLGTFTREKILETYESLGVNRLVIRAYPRWNLSATEATGAKFEGVDEVHDVGPLRRLFSEILLISPVVNDWVRSVAFAGRKVDSPRVVGVNSEYFAITNRHVILGRPFSSFHIKNRSSVCLLGFDIAKKLFGQRSPLDQLVAIESNNEARYSCRVLGVLESQKSNSEWNDPNKQLLVPESFLLVMGDHWNAKPYELNIKMQPGTSIENLSEKIKQFFHIKYGRSAQVSVDSDEVLVAQMRRFLSLFTVMLTGVALISLAVGGIGIANMMLVSVAERFKEIGLRKALGARDDEIRNQFLIEAMILCGLAGMIGIVTGICGYHLVLFFASKLFPQVKFELVFNLSAILLAFLCIVAVGLLSGLIPALRAQKLQVVEALRSE